MEADNRGPKLLEYVRNFVGERQPRRPGGDSARIDSVLLEVRQERCAPGQFALGARRWLRMAEEICVIRLGRLPSDGREFPAHRIRDERGAGQAAQPAGTRNRHSKRTALHASHGRLNDREIDSQQSLQTHHRILTCAQSQVRYPCDEWALGFRVGLPVETILLRQLPFSDPSIQRRSVNANAGSRKRQSTPPIAGPGQDGSYGTISTGASSKVIADVF
jgi:hypothetical protein